MVEVVGLTNADMIAQHNAYRDPVSSTATQTFHPVLNGPGGIMKVQVREIKGNWDQGFALDKHVLSSTFTGHNEYGHATFHNTRSEPGEALYKLKYRKDFSQIEPLADAVLEHILPRFGEFGLIIPMLPSNQRTRQPVNEIAAHLSRLIDKPLFDNILVKSVGAQGASPLKDMSNREEKMAALAGRITVNQSAISNEGCWNALLVDDLYDTGASMEVACAALRTYPKIGKIFVAAITWK